TRYTDRTQPAVRETDVMTWLASVGGYISWAQERSPTTRASQVIASVSPTAGGVPRVWRVPGRAWTAANGGTRRSTAPPGCSAANSSRVRRTAGASTERGGEMASAGDAAVARAQSCSAASPVCGSVRRVTTSAPCLRQQVMDGDGGRTVRAHADRADPAAG